MKEIQSENIRSKKSERLEVVEPQNPLIDAKDMCSFLCIILAGFVTRLLIDVGFFVVDGSKLQIVVIKMFLVLCVSYILIHINFKILNFFENRVRE